MRHTLVLPCELKGHVPLPWLALSICSLPFFSATAVGLFHLSALTLPPNARTLINGSRFREGGREGARSALVALDDSHTILKRLTSWAHGSPPRSFSSSPPQEPTGDLHALHAARLLPAMLRNAAEFLTVGAV